MSDDILMLKAPPADKRLAYGSDPNQFLDLRFPRNADKSRAFPLVINIHGGFWRAKYSLDHGGHLCAVLAGRGISTANLEYRRIGNEGGAWPGTFEDIRSAYQFLTQHAPEEHFDPRRILVMGHSAGGQLGLCLTAHEPGITRVVSLAGIVDLEHAYQLHLSNDAVAEFLRGTPAEVPDHYREANPMQLSIPRAHQSLIHGSADEDVPVTFSRDYVSTKQKLGPQEDVHLLEISGAGHMDLIDPRSAAWKKVEAMVIQLLAV
jgi:acetyl esterase/lipase